MDTSPNLSLWNSASKTDPNFTKKFQRGGGFRGTATNATYLARRATEAFGPCGLGWGVTVLDERVLDGADGVKVHRVHVELWYVLDGKRGAIQHFGQTEFCGKRASGNWYTDEEAPKKSLTDAMTKALSLLGFAADVHLGLYDDNKYVAGLKAEFGSEKTPEPVSSEPTRPLTPDDLVREIEACPSERELQSVINSSGNIRAYEQFAPPDQDRITQAIDVRRNAFSGGR